MAVQPDHPATQAFVQSGVAAEAGHRIAGDAKNARDNSTEALTRKTADDALRFLMKARLGRLGCLIPTPVILGIGVPLIAAVVGYIFYAGRADAVSQEIVKKMDAFQVSVDRQNTAQQDAATRLTAIETLLRTEAAGRFQSRDAVTPK